MIQKKIATLQEIETHYSITDLLDRNEALDAIEEAQADAEDRARSRQEAERGK